MNPISSSNVRRVVVAAFLLYGCGSDTLGGATGKGGASGTTGIGGSGGTADGGSGGTMAAGGSGGTLAGGSSGGTTGVAGTTGSGGRPFNVNCTNSQTRCPGTLCGNGVRDTCSPFPAGCVPATFTEWCDGPDLGGATCASLNLGSGTLRCATDCGFDTSGCSGAQGGNGGTTGAGGAGGTGGAGGADDCDPQPPPSFTTNYVTDPGFENGAAGWGISGVNGFEVTTSAFHCGTHGGKRTARNYATDGFSYSALQSLQGQSTFSLWVMQNGGSNLPMSVTVGGLCGDSTMGFGGVNQTIAPNQWTRLTGTIMVGSGCAVSAFLVRQASGSQLPDLFIDDVYIVR